MPPVDDDGNNFSILVYIHQIVKVKIKDMEGENFFVGLFIAALTVILVGTPTSLGLFFVGLFIAALTFIANLVGTMIVKPSLVLGILGLWEVVKGNFEYSLSFVLPEYILNTVMLLIGLAEWVMWGLFYLIDNLSNFSVVLELLVFEFPEKFFHRSLHDLDHVCNRFCELSDPWKTFIFVAAVFRSAVRAMALEKGRSVMPCSLLPILTIIKMSIHIDNMLSIHDAAARNVHFPLAVFVGACVVVDWSTLVWDCVFFTATPFYFYNDIYYLTTIFYLTTIIGGTLLIFACMLQWIPYRGPSMALFRHVQWMHCLAELDAVAAGFPAAQPIVYLGSLMVFVGYMVKRHSH